MKTIPDNVLAVLDAAEKSGNEVRLVGQLDRKLYTAVNSVLEAAGGKWNRKAKAHIFPGDAAEALEPLILTGEYATPKQDFQQFDTPRAIAEMVIDAAKIEAGMHVLEPSAGTGSLVTLADAAGAKVWAVELDPSRAETLAAHFAPAVPVWNDDFLKMPASEYVLFDRVIMNPPFARGQDIAHVRHAYDFLKPGGRLVAIMSPGWTFRQDRKFAEFRTWLGLHPGGYTSDPLPEQAFKESGTNVSTIMVTIDKPE